MPWIHVGLEQNPRTGLRGSKFQDFYQDHGVIFTLQNNIYHFYYYYYYKHNLFLCEIPFRSQNALVNIDNNDPDNNTLWK